MEIINPKNIIDNAKIDKFFLLIRLVLIINP